MKNTIFLALLLATIALVVYSLYSKYRVAPNIEFFELDLTDLDGNKVDLQSYAGKNILITMWAPWCRDCRAEMPALQYVKDQLVDDNFVFLAISGYDIVKEKQFADQFPYDFDYLHMSQTLKDVGVHAIPTNYIINSKGKVVYEKVGAEPDWKSEETIEMVRDLVK